MADYEDVDAEERRLLETWGKQGKKLLPNKTIETPGEWAKHRSLNQPPMPNQPEGVNKPEQEQPWAQHRSYILPEWKGDPNLNPEAVGHNPSTLKDVIHAGGIRVARGFVNLAGLPGDLGQRRDWLDQKLLERLPQSAVPIAKVLLHSARPPWEKFSFLPSSGEMTKGIESKLGPFYKPQTTAGEYAHTIGEYIPAATMGPEGIAAKLSAAAVPAVTSETAVQLTKGTAWGLGTIR
jgi:hypothetical protein